MKSFLRSINGVGLCVLIGLTAVTVSKVISFGAVSLAIILGIVIGNTFKPGARFKPGITFSEKHVLSVAIALMGVNLNFLILKELGFKSILIVVLAIFVTICTALILAGLFKMDKKLALLLGIGNGICGSSAIAATKQIVGANEDDVGLSIAIVNFLGTIGIFLLPFISGVVLRFTDINAGILIGNTLQAVGQVVAAGFSVNETVGQTAAIIKMTRILMLTPVIIILVFTISINKADNKGGTAGKKLNVPFFIIGFILFSLISTFKILPAEMIKMLSHASHYALILAMAGIGLKITFSSILKRGRSATLIGSVIFIVQIVFSTSMIYLILR